MLTSCYLRSRCRPQDLHNKLQTRDMNCNTYILSCVLSSP